MYYAAKKNEDTHTTWLYFDQLEAAVPFPGALNDWKEFLGRARQVAGGQGMSAMVLTWNYKGSKYEVDMNYLKVLMATEDSI
jgi:hypothetical protein